MTQPIAKRADELAVGDRIQPGFLPAYARSGEGTVRYLETYHYQGADWVFAAFACADGDRNCAYYLPGGMLKVVPADTGLVEIDPPEDPVCSVCRSRYSKHNALGLRLHGLAPANQYDESLDALAPCQPIGCDNGHHVPGCFYAKADA